MNCWFDAIEEYVWINLFLSTRQSVLDNTRYGLISIEYSGRYVSQNCWRMKTFELDEAINNTQCSISQRCLNINHHSRAYY